MNANNASIDRRHFIAAGATVATLGFTRHLTADESTSDAKPITQIAKFKLNMEKEEEAIKALEEMCKAVEETEPGVLAYVCHRSTKHPEEVVFFEVYKDDEALKAHAKTPHMGKLRGAFLTLFRPPLELTRLDRIAGFTRSASH
jgi:quinol monooxygenase YgiN